MALDEEDAPPLLVDIEENDAELEEEPDIKVPITIVTGKSCILPSTMDCSFLIGNRVPWSREDYIDELHFVRTAWKENSCHIEWYYPEVLLVATSSLTSTYRIW